MIPFATEDEEEIIISYSDKSKLSNVLGKNGR